MASNTRIDNILNLLTKGGGIAYPNTYKVTFQDSGRGQKVFANMKKSLPGFIESDLSGDIVGNSPASWVSLMCDEANLPGVQSATGQLNGIYTGSGQYNYAHTRMFNDLTLSWTCDANMTPLKFLNSWMDTIFNEISADGTTKYDIANQTADGSQNAPSRNRNRSVRLSYPDEYTLNLTILKAEKNSNSETGRASVRYVFEGIFPYAIDSIPLSFGNTTVVKVSANFYYERWFSYVTDQWGKATSTYNAK